MQTNLIVSIFLLIISALHAADFNEIFIGNADLTTLALSADISLVALTPDAGMAAAQAVPKNLQNLTKSISTALRNYEKTATPTIIDPVAGDNFTQSYGQLVNTVEEYMFDLYGQAAILISYHQQRPIYKNLLRLNTTFAAYGTYMHGVVGDVYHQNVTRNETRNAAYGIVNATARYLPGPSRGFFET